MQGFLVIMVESFWAESDVLRGILIISVGTNLLGLYYLTRMTTCRHNAYDRLRNKQILPTA